MPIVVVAGTGTGVGKTYVCRALHIALRERTRVAAVKPIESGFTGQGSDAEAIAAGAEWREPLYALEEALAPALAARRAGVEVSLARVAEVVAETARHVSLCLVESAGGLFTPLSGSKETNLDLVRVLEPCRWLLVAPNRLGVLSEVSAYLHAAKSEHRLPDRVLLSTAAPDASTASNAAELRWLWPGLAIDELGPGEAPPAPLLAALLNGVQR